MLCFDAPLQPQALNDVKFIVQKNVANGVLPEGITLEGSVGPVGFDKSIRTSPGPVLIGPDIAGFVVMVQV